MKPSRTANLLLLVVLGAATTAAYVGVRNHPRDPAPVPMVPPAVRIVDVMASNYAFDAPDSLVAGPVAFRLANHGAELHHLVIVPLPAGKNVGDLMREAEGDHLPAWAAPIGGPNAIDPGSHTETILELAPGRYAMVCIIPAADGMMHLKKGMAHEFVVTPAGPAAPLPAADLSMTLADFGFTLSGPLTAGHHMLEVTNTAAQPHELVVFKLAPGKHLTDFLAWFQHPAGAPPASAVGGASPMVNGSRNVVALDVEKGTYGIICFLPDRTDGQPHFVHGMMKEITVE